MIAEFSEEMRESAVWAMGEYEAQRLLGVSLEEALNLYMNGTLGKMPESRILRIYWELLKPLPPEKPFFPGPPVKGGRLIWSHVNHDTYEAISGLWSIRAEFHGRIDYTISYNGGVFMRGRICRGKEGIPFKSKLKSMENVFRNSIYSLSIKAGKAVDKLDNKESI